MTDRVYGKGSKLADIMFVGSAPGAQEIKHRHPLVGQAGKLLDKWLKELDLTRDDVFITNLIKEKLPKNRAPTSSEVTKYLPMLMKEVGEIDPKIIITLGTSPVSALTAISAPLDSIVGNIHQIKIQGKERLLMALYHPSYVSKSTKEKKAEMLDHLAYLKRVLANV